MLLGLYIVVGVVNILANINDFNIPNTPELRDIRVRRSPSEFEPSNGVNKVPNPKYDMKRFFAGKYFKERFKRSYPAYQQGYVSQVNTSWNNNGFYPGYYNGNSVNTPGQNGYNAVGRNNNNNPGLSYPGYYQYPNSTYPAYNAYPVYRPYINNSHLGYNSSLGNNQYPSYRAYIPYPNNTHPGNNQNPGYMAYIPYNNSYPGYNSNLGNNQYPSYNNANYNTNTYNPFNNTGYGYPIPGSTTPGYNTSAVSSTTPRVLVSCIICNIGCPQFMKRMGMFCVKDDDDYD